MKIILKTLVQISSDVNCSATRFILKPVKERVIVPCANFTGKVIAATVSLYNRIILPACNFLKGPKVEEKVPSEGVGEIPTGEPLAKLLG